MKSYVGIYDDALSEDQCKDLIEYFHNNPTCDGYVWSNGEVKVLPNYKKSTELDDASYVQQLEEEERIRRSRATRLPEQHEGMGRKYKEIPDPWFN